METSRRDRREHRAARRGRVVASGLTAAVTVGIVAAIAEAEATADEAGSVLGAVAAAAALEDMAAFEELTGAADPGEPDASRPPRRVGVVRVS